MDASRSFTAILRNQGRGITGALLVVGLSFLYTMETWTLGMTLPLPFLVGYAAVGLLGVFVVTNQVGFREVEDRREADPGPFRKAANFAELVIQSFVAAYAVMLLFGIVSLGDSLLTVVRLGLIQVVPLGIGASVSNLLLSQANGDIQEASFPRNLPTFVLGAVFISVPVAPTQEIAVIALQAGWTRLAVLVVVSVLVVHLVLHELEFRGHGSRIENRSTLAQLGTAFVVYLVGVGVAVALLLAFGQFAGTPLVEGVQQVIVLSFIASLGASAGEVVL